MTVERTQDKLVIYWCPACRKQIGRRLAVARKVLRSLCGVTGKTVNMKRLRWGYVHAHT